MEERITKSLSNATSSALPTTKNWKPIKNVRYQKSIENINFTNSQKIESLPKTSGTKKQKIESLPKTSGTKSP